MRVNIVYITSSKFVDATISNALSCWNNTPFTVLLPINVIAASLVGVENEKTSGSGTST